MSTVVHVITGLTAGGAEMMLYRLTESMDRARYAPIVVSLTDRGIYGDRIAALGVPLHTLGMRRGKPSPVGLWGLARVLQQWRPAIVQAWMYHANMAVSVAVRLARASVPVVWNVRASLRDEGREKMATALAIRGGAYLSGSPAGIIYNARTSARQHEAIGYAPARTQIIPNGFDCAEFRPDYLARAAMRASLDVASDEVLVGCFGRHDPMKDHGTFIRAAALALDRNPRLRFVLAGEGMDQGNAELMRTIEVQGMRARMHILGERGDMPRLNAALDISCLSSAWGEGFPNVLGEAMACGVPCVTTDTGDSAAIVGAAGSVVPPRNVPALADAIGTIAAMSADARRALGAAARARIVANYSLEAITRQYESYYGRILGNEMGDEFEARN